MVVANAFLLVIVLVDVMLVIMVLVLLLKVEKSYLPLTPLKFGLHKSLKIVFFENYIKLTYVQHKRSILPVPGQGFKK